MKKRRPVRYKELKELYGIPYSRMHLRRLMSPTRQQFPRCVTLVVDRPHSGIFWWSDEIEEHLEKLPSPVYKYDEDDDDLD